MNSKEDSTVVLYEGQILTSISSWKGQKRLSGSGGFEGAICRTQLNVLVPAEAVQERKRFKKEKEKKAVSTAAQSNARSCLLTTLSGCSMLSLKYA
jgi:hypothetical protein